MTDHQPPHNRDTEIALVACAWQHPDLTATLGVHPADLYGTDTEALWHALTTLHTEGVQPDPVLVLKRTPKQLRAAVNQLILEHIITGYTVTANAPAYAAEVRNLADRRHLLTATDRLRLVLTTPEASQQAIDDALTKLADTNNRPTGAQTTRDRYPALNLTELLNPNRPPREFVIEGLLPARAATALVAPAGTAKSLLALGIAIAVSQGHHRFAGFDIPRQRAVLYIDMENTTDDLAERFADYGLTPNDTLNGLTYLSLPRLPYLDTPEGGQDLAAILDTYQLQPGDLVIIDSLQRVIEGEENKADTLRAFYANAGIELKRRGLTVLRLDNTGKDTTKGSRGTSSKRDDVDVELVMVRDADDHHKFHIEVTKGRLGDFATRIVLTRDPDAPTITWSTGGDPFRSYVNECKAYLDQIGVAYEAGERPAYDAVRAAGRKFTRQVVRTAVKERRGRATEHDPAPTIPANPAAKASHFRPAADPENTPESSARTVAQVRQDPTAHPLEKDRAKTAPRTTARPDPASTETPSQTANQAAPPELGAPRRTPTAPAAPSAAITLVMAQQRDAEKSRQFPCPSCSQPNQPQRHLYGLECLTCYQKLIDSQPQPPDNTPESDEPDEPPTWNPTGTEPPF